MQSKDTASRLKQIMSERNLRQVDILDLAKPYCQRFGVKLSKTDLSQYVNGKVKPGQEKLTILGLALNVSETWLMGYDVPKDRIVNASNSDRDAKADPYSKFSSPEIAEDVVSFHPIGEVAAGYNCIAFEEFDSESIDIPASYLQGRPKSDYFLLTVKGDSMYPQYQDGDYVLVLKQDTLDRSGQIGVVLYDGDQATLKKVEYVDGEDWMKLIPLNPQYSPKTITGCDLEQCRILGAPRLIIRNVYE